MVAKELNFDELDQAVTNYMKKPPQPVTPPPPADTATPAMPAPSTLPVASKPAIVPVNTPVVTEGIASPTPTPATPAPPSASVPAASPRVQLRSRGGITTRKSGSGGSTFHDIMPAHRRSTVIPTKQLQPISDVSAAPAPTPATPMPPAKPKLPEEQPKSEPSAPQVNETPKQEAPSPVGETEKPHPPDEAQVTTSPPDEQPELSEEAPKILGINEADAAEPKPIEPATPEVVSSPQDKHPDEILEPAQTPAMSEALLEDLRAETKAARSPESSELPEAASNPSATPESPKTEITASKTSKLLAGTPLELEDGKAQAPGLLNTGELHSTATPVEPSHMLDAGNDEEQSMKVFDTKEYHTPITGNEPASSKSKKWEWIIVILVILIVAAAGFVAYIMTFASNT